jgi:uncharacterized OB-fold protein
MNVPPVVDRPVQRYPAAGCWDEHGDLVFLVGSRCRTCDKHTFPQRDWCDACDDGGAMEPIRLSRSGRLYSFSEVHVAPSVFTTPYVVGYIDLAEGVRVFAQIEHRASELALGEELEVTLGTIRTTADGDPVISYKFRKHGVPPHA